MPNQLASETSPYLRQHQDNPVDWFSWGEPAFDLAKQRNVPILLSVGYSACHWCHVMAHECFEDLETATLMNEMFVNIKVDREERPDIDALDDGIYDSRWSAIFWWNIFSEALIYPIDECDHRGMAQPSSRH